MVFMPREAAEELPEKHKDLQLSFFQNQNFQQEMSNQHFLAEYCCTETILTSLIKGLQPFSLEKKIEEDRSW